jgi:hypothetical protein
MQKKKVLLIDRSEDALHSMLKCDEIYMAVLIVATDRQKQNIRDLYNNIGEIYTMEEAQSFGSNDLSYIDIERYRSTQLKVEHGLWRSTSSYNHIQFVYYSALSFWLDIFFRLDIDIVVVAEIELGTPYISIPIDIAKNMNKPAFLFDPILNNGIDKLAKGVNYYNKNTYLDISEISGVPSINLDDFLFNSKTHGAENKTFKEKLKEFAFRPYGMALMSFLSFFSCRFNIKLNGFEIAWLELFRNALFLRKMSIYYDSISKKPKDGDKYIFYAMHFEPEASTLVRTPLSNQIYIIKMLADSLPAGWKLYIKEHPHQFAIVNKTRWYQLKNIHFFRNKLFYDEIRQLKSVELINGNLGSKDLIQKAQCIASINGTVAVEAIKYKKPLFLFGHLSTPFGYCGDVFKIASRNDLVNAVKTISGSYMPVYSDFNEVVKKYTFETSMEGTLNLPTTFWSFLVNQKL